MKGHDLKLMHLMMYMKSMLVRLLKNLNNVKSCTPFDVLTLNLDHKIYFEMKIILFPQTQRISEREMIVVQLMT
jgi:hypothetical protein